MIPFEDFWEIYPRKTAKKVALKSWERISPDYTLLEKIRSNIEARIAAGEWREKRFIPHPATYLNQERWEDEVIAEAKVMPANEAVFANEPRKTRDVSFREFLTNRDWAK